jgi:DNA-binding NarL/FixJ family response regulator
VEVCRRILVVDDDANARELISTVLLRAGFEACEAATADAALALVDDEQPILAVIDVQLAAGASGYELCHELQERCGRIPVVFVSGTRTEPFDRVAGLLIGGDDYLVKPFDPDELIARVRRLTVRASTNGASAPAESEAVAALTLREREVLQLLALGMDQPTIARELGRSPKTIATHIQNALAKLRLHSRAEAIAFAYRHGLVPLGPDAT